MLWGDGFRADSLLLRPILRYASAFFVVKRMVGQFDGATQLAENATFEERSICRGGIGTRKPISSCEILKFTGDSLAIPRTPRYICLA